MTQSVTVPGTSGTDSTPVTVSPGTGDVLQLAQQISNLLSSINTIGGGELVVSYYTGTGPVSDAPVVPSPTVNELLLSGQGTLTTIPAGYNYVVNTDSSPATLTGSNLAFVGGTLGSVYNV